MDSLSLHTNSGRCRACCSRRTPEEIPRTACGIELPENLYGLSRTRYYFPELPTRQATSPTSPERQHFGQSSCHLQASARPARAPSNVLSQRVGWTLDPSSILNSTLGAARVIYTRHWRSGALQGSIGVVTSFSSLSNRWGGSRRTRPGGFPGSALLPPYGWGVASGLHYPLLDHRIDPPL